MKMGCQKRSAHEKMGYRPARGGSDRIGYKRNGGHHLHAWTAAMHGEISWDREDLRDLLR